MLDAVDGILDRGGDADDVLRAVVAALVDHGGAVWAGILFLDEGELVLGPQAGSPDPEGRLQVPVAFQGSRVAELAVDGSDDRALLDHIAQLISPYCLVGWDTGGVAWDPD